MITLKNTLHDSNNGLDYTLVNDYYLPNLTATVPAERNPTGRWGRLHKKYLEEHHPIRYNQLLLSGKLGCYLDSLDKQADEQLSLIIRQMQDAEGVTKALKAENPELSDAGTETQPVTGELLHRCRRYLRGRRPPQCGLCGAGCGRASPLRKQPWHP